MSVGLRPAEARPGRLRAQATHLALYVLAPVAAAVGPLSVIPAVTGRFGDAGWATLAIALAVGNAGLIVGEVGWGVVGPQRVARAIGDRDALFKSALATKILAAAVIVPACGTVAAVLVPGDRGAAGLIASGAALAALSPTWYFVGIGRPVLTLVCETTPRVALAVAAAVLITLGAPLVVYGAALVATTVATWILTVLVGRLPWRPRRHDFRDAPATMRDNATLVIGRGVSVVYTSLPAAILGMVDPSGVALFAAVDRPLRMGVVVLGAIPARLQTYLGVRDAAVVRHRIRVALVVNVALGFVAAAVFALLMPLVAPLLFTGSISLGAEQLALGAALVLVICASRGLAMSLVARGRACDITKAILCAALVAAFALPTLGAAHGTDGCLVAVLAAEVVGVATQTILLARDLRRRPC